MSALQKALEDYLVIRRGLGFELRAVEWHLCKFVAFMEEQNASHITNRRLQEPSEHGSLSGVAG